MDVAEFDLTLGSGLVRVRQFGAEHAPATICVHGLSVNQHVFDHLAGGLAGPDRRVVTFDLRGRGRSPATPPGTYGLLSHVEDVLEVADQLDAERFDCVGWSFGAMVAILVAAVAGDRVRSLTLLDQVRGITDARARQAVLDGLDRLDSVVANPDEYVSMVRSLGFARPWVEQWRRLFAYELVPVDGGFTPSTSKAACAEDLGHPDIDRVVPAWRRLTMPVLVARAVEPMGGGHTIPSEDVARFAESVPQARIVQVDHNHYGIMTDDRTVAAVDKLLAAR